MRMSGGLTAKYYGKVVGGEMVAGSDDRKKRVGTRPGPQPRPLARHGVTKGVLPMGNVTYAGRTVGLDSFRLELLQLS